MRRVFGELEGAILQLFQKQETGLTVKEALPLLGAEDRYTTVMTVMSRLVEKGALKREKEGQAYRYFLNGKKPRFSLLESWRNKLFKGKTTPMITYLLGSCEKLTTEEIEEIEALLEKAKGGK